MNRPTMCEHKVERYLLEQCRLAGMLCMKFVSPGRAGVPDRIVVTPVGTVFVELKRPGGTAERRQLETHTKMRRYGAEVHLIDSPAQVDRFVADYRRRSDSRLGAAEPHPDTSKEPRSA